MKVFNNVPDKVMKYLKNKAKKIGKDLYQLGRMDNGYEISNDKVVASGSFIEYVSDLIEGKIKISMKEVMKSALDLDTFTFDVYEGRMNEFLSFVRKNSDKYELINKTRDGHYFNVKVRNKHGAENVKPLMEFYKTRIKI